MKTKSLKLFTVLVLTLCMSCSVENIQTEDTNQQKTTIEQKSRTSAPQKQPTNPTFYEYEVLHAIPTGTNTLTVYFDMNALENAYYADPNNLPIFGDFHDFYLSEMSLHFTVYNVTRTTNQFGECANIEMWVVNEQEYLAYVDDFLNGTIIPETNGSNTTDGDMSGGNNNSNGTGNGSGSGSDDSTKGGTKGGQVGQALPPPDEDVPSKQNEGLYASCFQ